ncbi:T-box transcription factor TBX15 isoform X1 [Pseudoliparis swirei]|uniref:T-box transcription factor TBX15 isoform X1 n=1 Tax=Pseudoliparis swirei TaxID=2059687 RepID=UPI0024BD8D56|nr:T-box transcription factor TBX15 isoform X1 [Pseudoliparis swirei]
MSERRRSAAALSSRAHAFSVEALIGSNKKRKLRGWEEKELGLSMESLAADGEEPAHCLDMDPDSEASPGSDGEGLAERTSCSFGSPAGLAPVPGPPGAACSEPPAPASMEEIQVELQCADLWKRFHDIGTEMIITKAGRRMFPAMRVKIAGLDPHQQYYIAMDIVPVDNKRYRYVYHSSKWMVAGNADSPVPPRAYIHPDSLASGDTWMRQVVSFDKLKLTNNELDDQGHDAESIAPPEESQGADVSNATSGFHPPGRTATSGPMPLEGIEPSESFVLIGSASSPSLKKIILHSMHKYQPRVHVIRKDFSSELSQNKAVPSGDGVKTFSFPETVFTTVTAYQNQQITRLKIDRNPFAKGFRDSGRNRTGLEAIMETYAFWRPPVRTLTFEDFTNMQKQQGGSTGTSPTASSTGTPSPSGAAHLLSPSCSPPAFHLAPSGFNVGCRESQLCSLGLEYPACARGNMAALQGYGGLADGSYGRLQAAGGGASAQPPDSFLPQRTSSLHAGGAKMDAYGGQLGSFPAAQLQYVMQAGGGGGPSPSPSGPSPAHMFGGGGHHHVQQGSYNAFSLHNPYNLYGYNFPPSPRLAASPEKPQGGLLCSAAPAGAFGERQYLSNGSVDAMHMIGNAGGGQQGGGSCDGRQYGSSSQMSMHMV